MSTVSTFSTPAKVTTAVAGTVTTRTSPARTMSALAKAPGRSALPSFGTSASMSRVRFCSLMDGEMRATRPVCSPATPSTVTSTDCPTRTLVESRSGTASRSRSGWSLTMVATGAPAARYSPTEARRSLTAPSIGEATTVSDELLARQLELGSALEQHGLSVAHLLDRVLVAALRHRQRRDGGVELRLGDQSLLLEALRALARELAPRRARRAPA